MIPKIDLFSLSVIPFDCGRYGRILICLMLSWEHNADMTELINSEPESERISLGVSCLRIIFSVKARATVSAVLFGIGIISVNLEKLSIQTSRDLLPLCDVTKPESRSIDTR